MPKRSPRDLNDDGRIDEREKAISSLASSVMDAYEDKGVGSHLKRHDSMNRAGVAKKYLDMFQHDDNEVIVSEIKKHPIGLVAIWGATAFAIILTWLIVGAIGMFKEDITAGFSKFGPADLTTAGIAIAACLTVLFLLFGYVAAFLYVNNRIIVTSEKLVQIRYYSLFNRKVSNLSIGDVQDTTVRRNGILPTIFGFGTVSIETAGEQDNYEFPLAVDAETNAKLIVQCHEQNLHRYGN